MGLRIGQDNRAASLRQAASRGGKATGTQVWKTLMKNIGGVKVETAPEVKIKFQ